MNLKMRLERLEQGASSAERQDVVTDPDCICYPASGAYSLNADEFRAAEELKCPLHGNRIPQDAPVVYQARWVKRLPGTGCRDPQFLKAARATQKYLEERR